MNHKTFTQAAVSIFKYSAGALLLAFALALFLINWTSPADYAPPHDPFFALPLNALFWIIGGIAAAAALICLFSERMTLPVLLPLWLAVNYLICRIGLIFEGCHNLAGYFVGFSYDFGISASGVNTLVDMVFAYLLIGSLVAFWLARRLPAPVEFQKMPCPSCGGHVKFPTQNLGLKGECPHCQATITLSKPNEMLKMSCFFCKEHIEFSAHALGRKIKCPRCKMEIGLKEQI